MNSGDVKSGDDILIASRSCSRVNRMQIVYAGATINRPGDGPMVRLPRGNSHLLPER